MAIVPASKKQITPINLEEHGIDVADLNVLTDLELRSAIERNDLAFLFSGFVNFSLPLDRIEPGVFEWERENMGVIMRVTAAKITGPATGEKVYQIPYGKMARAILLHICTEAVRTGDPVIDLGASAADYLKKLGFSLGGKTRQILYRQIQAVAGMHLIMSAEMSNSEGQGYEEAEMLVSKKRALWFSTRPDADGQDSLFSSSITLSDDFMNALVVQGRGIPVDEGAWRYINTHSRSAFPLDMYTWLAYRLHVCPKKGIKVPWERLAAQFGTTMNTHEFARHFRAHLPLVLKVYPQAEDSVKFVRGGVILSYAPSPIPERRSRKRPAIESPTDE